MSSITREGGLRTQLIGLGGVIERNSYLVKRYRWWELAFFVWTVANTLSIVLIAKGVQATGGHLNVNRATTSLLIGAVIWSYLGIIFEILTETVAWERWEGTIEYTFMAPLSRAVHLGGMALFAVLYGSLRTALLFAGRRRCSSACTSTTRTSPPRWCCSRSPRSHSRESAW